MKYRSIMLSMGLSLACLLIGACSSPTQTDGSIKPQHTPLIYFAGGKNGEPDENSCSIEIKKGTYKFNGGDNNSCTNDDMYFYRVDNAPSAALITLHAEDDCREEGGDWHFQLRIYINPTTTGWLKISDLKNYNAGDIVTAGVMYQTGKYEKGSVGGKLSCVTIDY